MSDIDKFVHVDEFACLHLLNKIECEDGEVVYWRECVGGEGYIVIFGRVISHHTNHYPPDVWK